MYCVAAVYWILKVSDEGRLEPGDLYVAERNQGPKLLTVQMVNWDHGFVIPTTNDYLYDIHECVKVKEFNRSIL